MNKRRLKYAGRPKALFGEEGAAILTAAGITAAATTAGAALSAKAAKDAAKKQADATLAQAKSQAEALRQQSEMQNENVTKQQDFVKDQYEQNRQIAKDTQMLLQQQMGIENTNERLEASKIKVKRGGNAKQGLKRMKLRNTPTPFLQGGSNIPFKVTDGGGANYVTTTPEGFDLYELYGNDHEHSHKAQGGKRKTGVGIKFYYDKGLTNTIEGEGNQNTNQGEYMLTMPNDTLFISKHSIKGFNPAKAVNGGMHPLMAYAIQERNKSNTTSPVGKMLAGGDVLTNILNGDITPNTDFSTDNMATTIAELGIINDENNMKLKNGGRLRCGLGGRPKFKLAGSSNNSGGWNVGRGDTMWDIAKKYTGSGNNWRQLANINKGINPNHLKIGSVLNLPSGWGVVNTPSVASSPALGPAIELPSVDAMTTAMGSFENVPVPEIGTPVQLPQNQQGNTPAVSKHGGFWNSAAGAQTIGAGIGALGNIIGGLITTSGNNRAADIMADAQQQGADIMSEAYRNLKTIDPSIVNAADYRAAHYMPAIHTARVNISPELEEINRTIRRGIKAAEDNSISGAARYKRISDMLDLGGQRKSQLYAKASNLEEERRAQTAKQISDAAAQNAYLDIQANQNYTGDRLKIAQYNNDINNQKILGSAGAISEGAINAANVISQARTSNASTWANALTNSAQGFANTMAAAGKQRADIKNVMLGASNDAYYRYLMMNGSKSEKAAAIKQLEKLSSTTSGKTKEQYDIWKNMLLS